MATANTTHLIKPVTITLAATPQNLGDTLGFDDTTYAKTPQCVHFAIQNKHAASSIYVQESLAATAADSIEVKAGDYYVEPPIVGTMYDLREYWIRAAVDGQKIVVKLKRS